MSRHTLQKLNVVKTVKRADHRNALLAKGFVEITNEKKAPTKTVDEQAVKAEGDKI